MGVVVLVLGISIHAPRTGSDAADYRANTADDKFQSTLPARGATRARVYARTFITFQSTLPARGATLYHSCLVVTIRNFNPRSPHGERRRDLRDLVCRRVISIHAPRTGSDRRYAAAGCEMIEISIHAPRTGSDRAGTFQPVTNSPFQSTLPARGATVCRQRKWCVIAVFQSTLPARGATRRWRGRRKRKIFQSTLPARGATTLSPEILDSHKTISIHAPRTGSDRRYAAAGCEMIEISIHAPRTGSDRAGTFQPVTNSPFQSTLPARGATVCRQRKWCVIAVFQSTLPARGATRRWRGRRKRKIFQSTLPARGATTLSPEILDSHKTISIHAPRTGSDFQRAFNRV